MAKWSCACWPTCSRGRSSRSSRPSSLEAPSSTPTSMASTPAYPPGAISTRRSAMPGVSMPATRTGTASARCTSTPWKGSGPCCAPGSARTGASRKTSCPSISASSSSCTTRAGVGEPCSAPLSQAWLREPAPPPRNPARATELYTALETKAIDGQEGPYTTILTSKINEVQKYLSATRHIYGAVIVLVGKKFWDQLSGDEKQILQDSCKEARDYERHISRDLSPAALAELQAKIGRASCRERV